MAPHLHGDRQLGGGDRVNSDLGSEDSIGCDHEKSIGSSCIDSTIDISRIDLIDVPLTTKLNTSTNDQ